MVACHPTVPKTIQEKQYTEIIVIVKNNNCLSRSQLLIPKWLMVINEKDDG